MRPVPPELAELRAAVAGSVCSRLDGRAVTAGQVARLGETQQKKVQWVADQALVSQLVDAEAAFTATFTPGTHVR